MSRVLAELTLWAADEIRLLEKVGMISGDLNKKRKIMRIISIITMLFVVNLGWADDHASSSAVEGAFTTLVVKANDIEKYIEVVKANTSIPEATGASAAGYCITRSGNDYAGQMFIWSAYNDVSEAMASITKYDPFQASEEFASLREVQYTSIFKPLKEFKLDPGFERLWRIVVPAENLNAFVEAITDAESMLRSSGYDVNIGVFYPLVGGAQETKTLHLRAVTRDGATAGKITEEYFAGAKWAETWAKAIDLSSGIESDTAEVCAQYFSAE